MLILRKAWRMLRYKTGTDDTDRVIAESEQLRRDLRRTSYQLSLYTKKLRAELEADEGSDD